MAPFKPHTWNRRATIAAAVFVVLLVAVGVWWRATRVAVPDVPNAELAGSTDPAVAGDLAKARQEVQDAPRSAAAWGEYGIALRVYGFHAGADVCLRTAAALDPEDGRWPYLMGHHLAANDPVAAVDWFRRAAEATVPDPAREGVQVRFAETLFAAGRHDEARAALAASGGDSARARLLRARLEAAAGHDSSALSLLSELAAHPVAARRALTLRSQIYLRQQRRAYAAHISDLARVAPDAAWPDPIADELPRRDRSRAGRLTEAARLLRSGQLREAEKLLVPLTTSTGPHPDAQAFVGLAEVRAALGDEAGALAALAQGAEIAPKDVAVNYQLGLRAFGDGERLRAVGRQDAAAAAFRRAVEHLDTALAADPAFGKAMLLKGVALQKFLGRPDDGIALLRQFVALRPEVAEGHYLLGLALSDTNRAAEARGELERAAELAPPNDRRAVEALAALASRPG